MSVLLAKQAQEEIAKCREKAVSLSTVLAILEGFDIKNIDSDVRVRRIRGDEADIYVLREGGLRIFFTKKANDTVVLSIENG